MVTIKISIESDADAKVLLDNFCHRLRYQVKVDNPDYNPQEPDDAATNPQFIDNPESKTNFWKRMMWEWALSIANAGEEMKNKVRIDKKYKAIEMT